MAAISRRSEKKRRVGVISDGTRLPAWIVRALEQAVRSGHAELALLVRVPPPGRGSALNRLLYRFFRSFERKRFPVKPDYAAQHDAESLFRSIPRIDATPVSAGREFSFSGRDCNRIREADLDILFLVPALPLTGGIFDCARHGVWHYGPASDRAPNGFWEALRQDPVTTIDLRRLGGNGKRDTILYSSASCTLPTATNRNSNQVYWKAAGFLTRSLRSPEEARPGEVPPPEPPPSNGALAFPLARYFSRRVSRKLSRMSSVEQWMLLYAFDAGDVPDFRSFTRILPPIDRFWADPFPIERDGRYCIFIEEAPFSTKRGHISVIEMDRSGHWESPVPVIRKPYHMSYPFLLEWEGELFMIPETSQNRTIDLYRCTRFPHEWKHERTLRSDVAAVDTTLLHHDDRWWFFLNIIENEGASSWDELFLFSGDSPVDGDWKPHHLNPVISDVRRARPAGAIYRSGNSLIRPSQNCSPRYGFGLHLNRITSLAEDSYSEELVRAYSPDWDPAMKAVHTVNRAGRLTVIDAIMRRPKRPSAS